MSCFSSKGKPALIGPHGLKCCSRSRRPKCSLNLCVHWFTESFASFRSWL
jgi:hypothetical protein